MSNRVKVFDFLYWDAEQNEHVARTGTLQLIAILNSTLFLATGRMVPEEDVDEEGAYRPPG